MALLNNTKKGRKLRLAQVALSGALCLGLLVGCDGIDIETSGETVLSGQIADQLKPDVNRRQKLLTDPSLVVSTFPEAPNDPYKDSADEGDDVGGGSPVDPGGDDVGGAGGGAGGGEAGGGDDVGGGEVTPTTEAVSVPVVPHDTYVQYLREKVLAPLDAAIGANQDIYYRVFTMGPNYQEYTVTTTFPAGEHTEQSLTIGSALDAGNYRGKGTAKSIDGLVMNEFLMKYFGEVGGNASSVTSTVTSTIKQFESNGIEFDWTPDGVPEDSAFRKSALFKMWNSEGNNTLTSSDFITKLGNGTLKDGTLTSVPNLILNYYTTGGSYSGRATVNAITNKDDEFTKTTPLGSVAAAFTHVNQFPGRNPAYTLDVNQSNETEMLRAYVDGYGTTIIYVGLIKSNGGPETIRDALGGETDVYNSVYNAVQGAATPNNISAVQAAGYEFTSVPTGVREGA